MFVIVSWQLSLVSPGGELVLLVAVRWSAPNLDVHIALVSSHGLVIGCEQQQKRHQDGAGCKNGLLMKKHQHVNKDRSDISGRQAIKSSARLLTLAILMICDSCWLESWN